MVILGNILSQGLTGSDSTLRRHQLLAHVISAEKVMDLLVNVVLLLKVGVVATD